MGWVEGLGYSRVGSWVGSQEGRVGRKEGELVGSNKVYCDRE